MLKIQGVKNNEENGGYIEVPDAEATMFVLYDLSEDGKTSKVLAAFATVEEATAAIAAWEASEAEYPDTATITTVDEVAQAVVLWHRECNAQIEKIANTPRDVDIKVTIYGKERNLTPSERKAFMEGARVAGEVFKDLPFQFTEGPVDGE